MKACIGRPIRPETLGVVPGSAELWRSVYRRPWPRPPSSRLHRLRGDVIEVLARYREHLQRVVVGLRRVVRMNAGLARGEGGVGFGENGLAPVARQFAHQQDRQDFDREQAPGDLNGVLVEGRKGVLIIDHGWISFVLRGAPPATVPRGDSRPLPAIEEAA